MAETALPARGNGAWKCAIAAAACLVGAGAAPIPAERAAELEHIVLQDCGSCHGLTRKGGLGSPLTPEALAGRDAAGLALIILDGIPGTAMPPWRPLMSEADAAWVAEYLLKEAGT